MVLDENGNAMHELTSIGNDAFNALAKAKQEWKELKKNHPFKWLWRSITHK